MAENGTPWRDILTAGELQQVRRCAGQTDDQDPQYQLLEQTVRVYHALPKDQWKRFSDRMVKLEQIERLCVRYTASRAPRRDGRLQPAKSALGKKLGDPLSVWVSSLGRRAAKKRGYLGEMLKWHILHGSTTNVTCRRGLAKYVERAHVRCRQDHDLLGLAPDAEIEKLDPYHRKPTFRTGIKRKRVFMQPFDRYAQLLVDYLAGRPARDGHGATHADASFFEWLEYSPFCTTTPALTLHPKALKSGTLGGLRRVVYQNEDTPTLDIILGRLKDGKLWCNTVLTNPHPENISLLCTHDYESSDKGPDGSVAFVWARNGDLLMHPHQEVRQRSYTHSSVCRGDRVRCAGMLVANHGVITYVDGNSGHYRPRVQQLFEFCRWLHEHRVLSSDATIRIKQSDVAQVRNQDYLVSDFLARVQVSRP